VILSIITLNIIIKNVTSFRMSVSMLRDTQFNDTHRLPLINLSKASFTKPIAYKKMICGLYYKTITIVIMTIVSDDTIWSVTYDRN
jgi:hypothetical protein